MMDDEGEVEMSLSGLEASVSGPLNSPPKAPPWMRTVPHPLRWARRRRVVVVVVVVASMPPPPRVPPLLPAHSGASGLQQRARRGVRGRLGRLEEELPNVMPAGVDVNSVRQAHANVVAGAVMGLGYRLLAPPTRALRTASSSDRSAMRDGKPNDQVHIDRGRSPRPSRRRKKKKKKKKKRRAAATTTRGGRRRRRRRGGGGGKTPCSGVLQLRTGMLRHSSFGRAPTG